jgi:DNA (cytosine-5)-methyltransferase 1
MRFLSLFSGIEAASVAFGMLGWKCVAVSEILEYQSNVIKKHYPDLKNFGDVTKITEDDIKALGKIDVIIFGSPCQDMSIAGKRQGLETVKEDTNHSSILFFEGMRVFRLAQKHCDARFLIFENVPGALSSNNGEDFGKILSEMVGVRFNSGRLVWGNEGCCFGRDSMCEWSVLDAQWFGVAQRRRRLFVVLDTGNWQDRRPILLEQESSRGSIDTLKEKRQGTSTPATKILGEDCECLVFDRQSMGEYSTNPIASTITGRDYKDFSDLIAYDYKVRKLTPMECERLQGFDDGYTDLGGTTFGKRINALGRSMAVPVITWIGKQIEECENV